MKTVPVTVPVVAVKKHTYASEKRNVGYKYDADPKFLPLLERMKWVTRVEEVPATTPTKEPSRRKSYKRRDMKAEE